MTALGTHEHFQCDQCKTQIRRKPEDLHSGDSFKPVGMIEPHEFPGDEPLHPQGWLTVTLSGGNRLKNIHHLCSACRDKLDRHFFGPRKCDAPTIDELERLLNKVLKIGENWAPGAPPPFRTEPFTDVVEDINHYFNPGIAVES